MSHNRLVLLTSAVAFALACLVMITMHELAHAVAGVLQGHTPTMYGFSVEQGDVDDGDAVVTALAGPLFSLVSGLLLLAVPVRGLPGFWRLAVTWAGLVSVQEFSGYLITGPFAHVGDIGTALQRSGAPGWVGWLGFVVGWALTFLLGRYAVARLGTMIDDDRPFAPQLRALGLFAWLLGAAVVIVLSAGLLGAGDAPAAVVVFEALGVVASGIFLVVVRLVLGAAEHAPRQPTAVGVPVVGIVLLVLLAVARQLVLGPGITF